MAPNFSTDLERILWHGRDRDRAVILAMQRKIDRNPIRGLLWRKPWRSPSRPTVRGLWQWLRNAHDCADPAVGCSCSGGYRFPPPGPARPAEATTPSMRGPDR